MQDQLRRMSRGRNTVPGDTGSGVPTAGSPGVEREQGADAATPTLVAYMAGSMKGFSREAVIAATSDVEEYVRSLNDRARDQAFADHRAEIVLLHHVTAAGAGLRSHGDAEPGAASDWSKWVGFLFVGLAIQQFSKMHSEKHIASGAVTWLLIDVVISAILLTAGFIIDMPLRLPCGRRNRQ